jgi:steroid delta-isomerase-like uncharacterized protein
MSDNAGTARALFDAWERRDLEAVVRDMADDVTVTDLARGEVMAGRDAAKAFYASWATACPDSTAGHVIVASSGDAVAVEGTWKGTNTGPFGPFGPTGRTTSMPWVNNIRFGADGKIVAITALYDQMTVLTQLGHLAPASA